MCRLDAPKHGAEKLCQFHRKNPSYRALLTYVAGKLSGTFDRCLTYGRGRGGLFQFVFLRWEAIRFLISIPPDKSKSSGTRCIPPSRVINQAFSMLIQIPRIEDGHQEAGKASSAKLPAVCVYIYIYISAMAMDGEASFAYSKRSKGDSGTSSPARQPGGLTRAPAFGGVLHHL